MVESRKVFRVTGRKAFWHRDEYNFGDTLTVWLLARYGVDLEWAPAKDADIVAVGSILDAVPPTYTNVVWGTGLIKDRPHRLPSAQILGVRGALTAAHIGHPDAPLGDPGLLLADHIPAEPKTGLVGLVPHKIHLDHPFVTRLAADPGIRLIDPREPVEVVARAISGCAAILSTSLHGLITADSYGIPALWADLPSLPLAGSRDFKFLDHETAVNVPGTSRRIRLTAGATPAGLLRAARPASPERVAAACEHLRASITGWAKPDVVDVPPRIGIAITTRDRRDHFLQCLAQVHKHTPGAVVVVVDDASKEPVPEATFRFDQQAGIARAKNKCLELLADAGVDHMFLFDDDCWPVADGWWESYVASPEPHLMYIFNMTRPNARPWKVEHQDDHHAAWNRACGCMLYVERRAVDVVGGMRTDFGLWGGEHVEWSRRVHDAGLTTWQFADVTGSGDLFYSMDEHWRELGLTLVRSVDDATRRRHSARNVLLLEEYEGRSDYVEYRLPTPPPPPEVPNVAFVVIGCSKRAERAEKLLALLQEQGARAELMMDDAGLGERENHARAWDWGARHPGVDWVVTVEDDALPVDDFVQQALAALGAVPGNRALVMFYTGVDNRKNLQRRTRQAQERLDRTGGAWLSFRRCYWGVAVAAPQKDCKALAAQVRLLRIPSDEAIGCWAVESRIPVLATWPSLVDHDMSLPSVLGHGRGAERRAHRVGAPATWATPLLQV